MTYSIDKVGRGMMEQKESLVMFKDDNAHTHTLRERERKQLEKWAKIREVSTLKGKHSYSKWRDD